MKCERCGTGAKGLNLFDYYATCSKNLCDECMKKGCCGRVPAVSGNETETVDELLGEDDADPED